MYVLIIVIHYYMVYLTTVSKDYKKNNEQRCAYFCKLAKFHHNSVVLTDFHCLPVRLQSLNLNLLGIFCNFMRISAC